MGKTGEKIKRSFQYVLLAVATGVLVGILDTIFGRGLLIISDIRNLHYLYLLPFFAGRRSCYRMAVSTF
ncbi:MAG: hypothetical protein ACLR6H_12215 [Roseburia sp.]